ncbi:ComEA family DNA-binding protein [Brevibacterium album]|uniref:ComEA family DNA-binding protein n=1 Tax=Brevibacterium album TaxID=417948 RepID=UPI000429C846|nr:ComEA family DNA-binding protein [Brevibacterium album]
MSPSPAERFSALLAAGSERGWSPGAAPGLPALAEPDEDERDAGEPDGRRLRPSTALVLVLVGLGLAGAAVLALVPELRPGRGEEHIAAASAGEAWEAAESGGADAGGAPEEAAGDEPVLVHVVGAVAEEGVVELPGGARLADALEAAGGTLPDAAPAALNLARPLADGEQVRVPTAEEVADGAFEAGAEGVGEGGGDTGAAARHDGAGARVDLNTADSAALETLPGVGPVTAQAIIDHREAHGGFASVEELIEVSGIGEATLGRLRDLVAV